MCVYALMAHGTEEAELITVIDIIKRSGIEVKLISTEEEDYIIGSHGITIKSDLNIKQVEFSNDLEMIFIPGGMPGSQRIGTNLRVIQLLKKAISKGKRVSAICAAPALVLGVNDLLKGLNYTCYPGLEQFVTKEAKYINEGFITDGKITTGRALGSAIDFGLELVRLLLGKEKMEEVKKQIIY